ncbi:MAG: hypothetical protein EXQ88_00995 [Alphaproteobacteria bacterium]|nr:hypothetical protein [Alphaproteobacteria bacterium]
MLDPNKREKFGTEFLDRVVSALNTLEQRAWKATILSCVLIGALLLQTLGASISIVLPGIQIQNVDITKEIIFLLAVSINIFSSFIAYATYSLRIIRDVMLDVLYEDKTERYLVISTIPEYLGSSAGITHKQNDNFHYTIYGSILTSVVTLIPMLLVIGALMIPILVQVYILMEIVYNGNASGPWHDTFVWLSVLFMIGGLLLSISRYIPIPFTDYSAFNELMALQKSNPDLFRDRFREIIASENDRSKKE